MSSNNESKEIIIRCHCGDVREHSIHIAQYNSGDTNDDKHLGICNINMCLEIRQKWYKRIWTGIKYMFGYTNHMHYMDTMVDVEVLKDAVSRLEDTRTDEQKASSKEQRTWTHYEVL
jgi:hypothetical protein